MQVTVEASRALVFDDGTPVRAASALARLGDGWLVAQDDATHGAWVRPSGTSRLRLLPAVQGLDTFSEAEGTKALKPDLEAACGLVGEGLTGVLLLGSGSTAARRGGVLVLERDGEPLVTSAELGPLYEAVQRALGLDDGELDVEGVARNGDVVRWFSRGNPEAGVPDGSVDVGLPGLLEALRGQRDPADVPLQAARRYDLGVLGGLRLSATDAVALPGGRVLLSAAAEDTPNAVDDGPVRGSALALLEDDRVLDVAALPLLEGVVQKVEGLGVLSLDDVGARLLAVVDADDPAAASLELTLRVVWG
ncbi:MAG: hypothetical protein JWM64_2573 [Frankiales bacterium]|nr:hypothetical protein [Frankiales bacterium]